MSWFLTLYAAHAAEWYEQPLAGQLHPVHDPYMHRWQAATADAMAGPNASPLFRETASQADVYWRLVDAGYEPLWYPDPDKVFDLSLAGTSMGLGIAFRDTIDRSDELSVVRRAARAATSPGFELRQHDDGYRLQVNEERAQYGAHAIARIQEPRDRRPEPGLALGTGLRLVGDEDAIELSPEAGLSTWAQVDHLGVDTFRVEGTLTSPDDPVARWVVVARQGVYPGVSLLGDVRSTEDGSLLPGRVRGGLSLGLPGTWTARTSLVRSLPVGGAEAEWAVELSLKTARGWHIPSDIDRWPLGADLDGSGRPMPWVPERGPNQVAWLVQPPESVASR